LISKDFRHPTRSAYVHTEGNKVLAGFVHRYCHDRHCMIARLLREPRLASEGFDGVKTCRLPGRVDPEEHPNHRSKAGLFAQSPKKVYFTGHISFNLLIHILF
jgi:hypothetical protein